MEHGASLTSLMIVVGIAFLVPVALHRLRLRVLPVIVAEILAGVVVGKSGLNWIAEDPYLELLSALGLIYLMFLSGLELDFSVIGAGKRKRGGANVLRIGLALSGAVLAAAGLLAFGLQAAGLVAEPIFFTIVISAVSLGIVVPVLKEKRLMETVVGQAILLVTVVLDLAAMLLLAFYISLRSQNMQDLLELALFFALVYAAYRIIRRLLERKGTDLLKAGTIQIGTRAVFALILLFVALSETLGVELILGAFLAGAVVSLMMPKKEFVHKLETFGYGFLIPIFFVMVGANLDLGALLGDATALALLPALLFSFYAAKMVPSLLLKKWFGGREAFGAGVLLSANLSLVVAAAEVAVKFHIIDEGMRGALILVAVLSCFISPIVFGKFFPRQEAKRTAIGIVGANHITLPVSLDLEREQYDVELFTAAAEEAGKDAKATRFPLREVERLDAAALAEAGLFGKDVVVLATADDDVNLALAREAKERGVERVVARVETPGSLEAVEMPDVQLISSLYAARTLLKAVIEHPSAVQLITQHDDSIQEAELRNPAYDGMLLRQLPFLGDALVMRIFRGDSFVVPHGNTEVKLGDRLLISGDAERIADIQREMS
ncbi:cation:proton antiporter [Paenibacillus sp.]|uniref:cation:proton antiporter domain-containing protein n=1 Tax=Paenibacillus sp. TaxID=58172 RepID=UPI002D4AB8EE|nr:cation:proton antiporter [Paenibacillus sp.]HZG83904.1 cation:proton antiporter [Paenibacillus sp.]